MEANNFDAIAYFTELATKNKLAKAKGFLPVTISNIENIEGLLEQYRENDRFVAISDTSSGNLASADGTYGFSQHRAYTIFVLSAYEYGNMEEREQELDLCRKVFHQFVSKIIHDKYEYEDKDMFFDTRSFPNQEIGRYFLSGMTGLHFTAYMEEPMDLEYDDEQWT